MNGNKRDQMAACCSWRRRFMATFTLHVSDLEREAANGIFLLLVSLSVSHLPALCYGTLRTRMLKTTILTPVGLISTSPIPSTPELGNCPSLSWLFSAGCMTSSSHSFLKVAVMIHQAENKCYKHVCLQIMCTNTFPTWLYGTRSLCV